MTAGSKKAEYMLPDVELARPSTVADLLILDSKLLEARFLELISQ